MSDKTYSQPPEFSLDPEKNYKAIIEMDNGNKITIDLLSKEAPKTVNNFVFGENSFFKIIIVNF